MTIGVVHLYHPIDTHEMSGDAGSFIGVFALVILQAVGLAYWLGTLSARVSATAARVVYLENHGGEAALRDAAAELREYIRRIEALEGKIDRLLDKHLKVV